MLLLLAQLVRLVDDRRSARHIAAVDLRERETVRDLERLFAMPTAGGR